VSSGMQSENFLADYDTHDPYLPSDEVEELAHRLSGVTEDDWKLVEDIIENADEISAEMYQRLSALGTFTTTQAVVR
jgi:hypothetical protein